MALTECEAKNTALYDIVASKKMTTAGIYKIIREFFESTKRFPPGEYMLLGLDASVDSKFVTNFSTVISLTKTESLIVRALIRAYPSTLSPKQLLRYAFSQSKLPDPTSIRTYICSINKKFHHRFARKLVVSLNGGYVILTPELAEENNIEFDYRNELKWII